MRKSIHRFLTVNILISVSLSVLLGVVGNFYFKHRNIDTHLDAELSLEARVIESFLCQRLTANQIPAIQRKINQIPIETIRVAGNQKALNQIVNRMVNNTQFQVWDTRNNRLILRSPSAPALPLKAETGYNNTFYQNRQWRTYSVDLPDIGYQIVSMQQHELRLGYEKQVIYDTMFILVAVFFLLTLSTRVIIRRSLYSLEKTTGQLKSKAPSNLDPLMLNNTPDEIHPLLHEINRLMSEITMILDRERRFAGDAAHELKTPLAAMKAHIQLAARQDPEAQKISFKKIEDIIDRYDHIIRQLLSLSRTISQSALSNTTEIDVIPVAKSVISQIVPIALNREIQIAFECEHAALPLRTNPSTLSVMMANIIDNATKYTHDGDHITVRLLKRAQDIQFIVIDHGPGISEEDKALVTQRFKRLYGTNVSGSGLGMNIVSEIIRHLDGDLVLSDTPSGGLTVTVTIPYPVLEKPASSSQATS